MSNESRATQRERVPIDLPELTLDAQFSCDMEFPDVPFLFMRIRWSEVCLSWINISGYLERPDELLHDLREAYRVRQEMETPQYKLPWRPHEIFTPYNIRVYKGLGNPMSIGPWDWIERSDKYLTLVRDSPIDCKTESYAQYIKLSEHQRIVKAAEQKAQLEIEQIVREQIGTSINVAVKQALKDGTVTLRQIETQRERLEAERAALEARIAELNTIEEQAVAQQKAKQTRRQPADTKGYVYLLQTTVGYWKIGRTRNPENRLRTFNVKLPFPVEYAHLIECADMYAAEDQLHRQFADKRINNSEFFALDNEDVIYIKSLQNL